MLTLPKSLRRVVTIVASTVVVAASLTIGDVVAAHADTAPADPSVAATVSTDVLPTVQIDGVVWSQVIVGNTVYAGGSFTTARPAGSAAGVNTVTRTNLLAYDITTGNLITSFNPTINGQVRGLAVSADKSKLYVVGDFDKINDVGRYRAAAFDIATGALDTSFKPIANTRVFSVSVTSSAVYLGGWFTSINSTDRSYAAAVNPTSGALLPFNPVLDDTVSSIVVSPDGSKVAIGGRFQHTNGSSTPGYGLALVDSTTGSSLAFPINDLVRNGGAEAGITSLSSDGTDLYGTGYVFGSGGNLEGTFHSDWNGNVIWIEDCHGDSYGVAANSTAVYVVSHAHYCGNVGGFPQTDPTWTTQRAMAWSKAADPDCTITPDTKGYFNWAGNPCPDILNWWPDLLNGSFTGQGQAAWSVAATDKYVVLGGEFPAVNNKAQQGLVRFAVSSIAPNADGPRVKGADFVPNAISLAPGTVRLAWLANYDRDNQYLTYKLIRDGKTATPIYTTTQGSRIWWDRPQMGYVDTGLTPGSTHSYALVATDPFGNSVTGSTVSVTVSSTATSGYTKDVLTDGASTFYRLGEASGTAVYDWSGFNDASVVGSGVTRGATGAIVGDTDTASTFSGDGSFVTTPTPIQGPNTFAVSTWFKTTSTSGGKIVGFGNSKTGSSSSYDRHLYMGTDGTVYFGVYTGQMATLRSSAGLNDGQWHLAVADLSSGGMNLYIDGERVGHRTDVTAGQNYQGYWRIGGDSSWSGANYFTGTIDDTAIYPAPLTRAQVDQQWVDAGYVSALPTAPSDAYGASVFNDNPDLYWRLGESGGATAADSGPNSAPGSYQGGVTYGLIGAVAGTSDTAVRLNGSDGAVVSSRQVTNPQVYSEEAWFKTSSNSGGKIIGFGDAASGQSSNYDRHIYMQDNGQLVFGTYTNQTNTITTSSSYNDGAWHYVVATQSSAGLKLYVDGVLQGTNPQTQAQSYSGYWRVGGDTTWGSSSAYFAGTIDEVAVYSDALSPSEVADHYALGTGTVVNVPPTASFTATPAGLTVNLDATASSDPDGTVSSMAWDYGDGATGTGQIASHSYATAGTYVVSLTVTDNSGATSTSTKSVTVAAPNQAPTASFTTTASDLSLAVDASASSDPDGTIASSAWDFGDGTTGTGTATNHTYTTGGTYTVTLTVTDDSGATASITKSVTVSSPASSTYAQDAFARTLTSGWGSADIGGSWTTGTSSAYSVAGGVGQIKTAIGSTLNATLASTPSTNTEVTIGAKLETAVTGTGEYVSVLGRKVGTDDYRVRAKVQSTGVINLQLMRGTTSLTSGNVSGLSYAAGDTLQFRLQVTGTSPTTIRARVWKSGTTEPTTWQLTTTDSTAALQAPGTIGLQSYLGGSATSAITIDFSSLWAGAPGSGVVTPPANLPPTAAFTATATALSLAVNGVASSDSGGTIAAYAWTFGDGGTATGATPTHNYATAGTYTVGLTVTDDKGATAATSQTVTVSAPAAPGILALDQFERVTTSGWGTATTGGAWTQTGTASAFGVSGGTAHHVLPLGGTLTSRLTAVSSTTSDTTTSVSLDKAATGGGVYVSLLGRVVGTSDYRGRVKFLPNGVINLTTMSGSTALATANVAGLTYTTGDKLNVRVQVSGTAPTTIRMKVWKAGTTEPTTWALTSTDSTAALQTAGSVAIQSYLSGSSTNAPVTVSFDDYQVAVIQ